MGPTASGKTDLAIALTRLLPCDIISVDSAQVYRGMDIGSAKPGPDVLTDTPHRLISFLDPSEPYSAACFRHDAIREMESIQQNGRIPLLVGGTMLYFKVLQQGIAELPAADSEWRKQLTEEASRSGWPALHARLAEVDPETAARLHPNHSQRIMRALEVHALTGIPLSSWHARQAPTPAPWRFIQMALSPADKTVLDRRIEQRFQRMLEEGFLDEVRQLHARGDLHAGLPAIRSVGYRQAWAMLEGQISPDRWVNEAIRATRQLARRQMTWLRQWPDLHWLHTEEPFSLEAVSRDALKILGHAGI